MSKHYDPTNEYSQQNQHKFSNYLVGFLLSLGLTIVGFVLVLQHSLSEYYLYIIVSILALVQCLVQVLCFIRPNTSADDGRWNLMACFFTILIIFMLVGGSLWIMYNLNYNMAN